MPATFVYRVRDKGGRLLEGSLEADNTGLVATRLREMGYYPISIEAKPSSGLQTEIKIPGFAKRVKTREIAVFARQFATMINAGLTMLRALNILAEQTSNPALAKAIDGVRTDVQVGASLSQALARHPKIFSKLFVSMVRAGETAGVLDQVLLQLAATLERQAALRTKVRSAMAYPVAVMCLVSAIATAMLIFVVPMFKSMYKQVGGKLPAPTQLLINVSHVFSSYFPFLVALVVAGFFGIRRAIRRPRGRLFWDTLKLRTPIFGRVVHRTALSRFAHTLSVLLRSGVPILESLEITSDTVNNAVMAEAIKEAQNGVRGGDTVSRPLAAHSTFPPMVTQMMSVGEETGALDEMLAKVASFYDQEVESLVDGLTSLIEPLLIVVMGALVGGMVICLYLPMFNIINAIKQ
jgi:type IV pilus assembly protein PilC